MNRSRSLISYQPGSQIHLGLTHSKLLYPAIEHTLNWFESLGYQVLLQSDIVSGRHQSILQHCRQGILGDRLRPALQRLNPQISQSQIDWAWSQLLAPRSLPLLQQNRQWHLQLLQGIQVPSPDSGQLTPLKLIDFTHWQNNDWLVIHSFPVIEADYQHCLDLVVFVNGLPLAVFHGLQGSKAAWSLRAAYLQLQDYQTHLPRFFACNEMLILSNGVQSRVGTLTSSWQQLSPIQTANGEEMLSAEEMGSFIRSVFDQQRWLEILQHCIIFQQSRTKLTKKLCTSSFCTVTLHEDVFPSRDYSYPPR